MPFFISFADLHCECALKVQILKIIYRLLLSLLLLQSFLQRFLLLLQTNFQSTPEHLN